MAQSVPVVRNDALVLRDGDGERAIVVGTQAWYAWLATATSFSFASPLGTFTACKEYRSRGGGYWKAYRKRSGKLHRAYLGASKLLTVKRLNEVAAALANAETGEGPPPRALNAIRHQPLRLDGVGKAQPALRAWDARPADEVDAVPLLQTKLSPPLSRPELVVRSRLIEPLSDGLRRPLTLVSAPAGFGKTTLLAQWHLHARCRVAWLSLDAGDNDPTRFWAYVIAALQTSHPDLGSAALRILRSRRASAVEPYLTVLINDIAALPESLALVLDDYHLIEDDTIHRGMAFLLDHLPRQLHIIIATRADPPLPLARLMGRGQVMELRAADLAFTREETAAFLNEVMGLDLSAEHVVVLEERTEGWIVGLQMAALSIQPQKDVPHFVRAFSVDNRYVVSYLVEEVLSRQAESVRDFLLRTSILDRLSASLCAAVTGLGEDEGQAMLETLERANLFTVPLDSEQHWYRYHHLFASSLSKHLQRSHPGLALEVHRRACAWFRAHGLAGEAVRHGLAGGEFELVASVVEQYAPAMLKLGEWATLIRWVRALPPDLVNRRPRLCLFHALALILVGNLQAAEPWMRQVERSLDTDEAGRSEGSGYNSTGDTLAARAALAVNRRDLPLAIALARQALELLDEEEGLGRGQVFFLLGEAYWFSGEGKLASEAMIEAATMSQASGHFHVAGLALGQLAGIQAIQGRLHQAVETYRQALQLAVEQRSEPMPVANQSYAGLALVHYEWNDLNAARRYAQESIALAERGGMIGDLVLHHRILARLQEAQGDLEGAIAVMERAEHLAIANNLPRELVRVAIYRPRLWVKQGNVEAAVRWAETSGLGVDDEPSYRHEAAHLTLARVLIAQGKPAEASRLLERLQRAAESAGRTGIAIKIRVANVIALQAQGKTGEALEVLGRTLSLAEPERYVRTFIDEGAPMAALLAKLLDARKRDRLTTAYRVSPHYVRTLLAAFDSSDIPLKGIGSRRGSAQKDIVLLSEREMEVLRLIGAGWDCARVAQELIVSRNTVKAHVKSIYSKLDAHTRTQAVAKARDMNLL